MVSSLQGSISTALLKLCFSSEIHPVIILLPRDGIYMRILFVLFSCWFEPFWCGTNTSSHLKRSFVNRVCDP